MPVQSCSSGDKPGYRWGEEGKCYTYSSGDESGRKRAKQQAYLQGAAIGKSVDADSAATARSILVAKIEANDTDLMSPAERAAAAKIGKFLGYIAPDDEGAGDVMKTRPGCAMICWRIPMDLAHRLQVPGGEVAGDLHMTLAYFEPYDGEVAVDADLLAAALKVMTAYTWETRGEISGVGRFVNGPDADVMYASVDMPGLEDLRARVLDAASQAGLYANRDHGFTPHITLAYLPKDMPNPGDLAAPIPTAISSLAVVTSVGDYAEFPLRPIEELQGEAEVAYSKSVLPEEVTQSSATSCPNCGSAKVSGGFCSDCEVKSSRSELVYDPVIKSKSGELRYTMGPLYAPDRVDAHGEYAEDDELHEAMIEYSLANDRRMRLMHDTDQETGTWVELMRWPYEHEIELTLDGETVKQKMPAGTIYMGVIWDEAYWPAVKTGKIGGLSLGGRAVRVAGDSDAPKEAMGLQTGPREET